MPTPPNRIESLTTATPATDAALAPIDPLRPAAGGWQPTFFQRVALVSGASLLGSLAVTLPLLLAGPVGLVIGGALGAIGIGIGTLAGLQSAGPRKLE